MTRPRIGLALGSDSARGWSHIGVIDALNEAGIEPDVVCGTSMGAFVGGAYVAGGLAGGGVVGGNLVTGFLHRFRHDQGNGDSCSNRPAPRPLALNSFLLKSLDLRPRHRSSA